MLCESLLKNGKKCSNKKKFGEFCGIHKDKIISVSETSETSEISKTETSETSKTETSESKLKLEPIAIQNFLKVSVGF